MIDMTEKYMILYFKDDRWKFRIIRANSPIEAEEKFVNNKLRSKDVEYYEIYVFTGVTDYV